MQILGGPIRDRIETEIAARFRESNCALALVIVGEDPVTRRFVEVKKRFAERIGCRVEEILLPAGSTTEELIACVEMLGLDSRITGIVAQLPLPAHIDAQLVLNAIPVAKDVDMLSDQSMAMFVRGESLLLPPVLGAIVEVLKAAQVDPKGKRVLVLGSGRLVGAPAARYFEREGAGVEVVDRPTSNLVEYITRAEIVVSGTGVPGLVQASMVLPHHILIDAGTSESAGKIFGDVNPLCYEKVRFSTPVPGGIGPITVAVLFRNLAILGSQQSKNTL